MKKKLISVWVKMFTGTVIGMIALIGGINTTYAAPFDFDADGKSDFSIYRPTGGEWWYLRSSDGNHRAFQFGGASDVIVPASYTNDGKIDIAFYRDGFWYILRSEDFSYYGFPFGLASDIPVPADYDGDGKADPAVYRASETKWYILKSTGGVSIQQFGAAGEVPVPADYDGDGRANLAMFNSATNSFRTRIGNIESESSSALATGDVAVSGDYTGDGKADHAVYSPASRMWAVIKSEDQSIQTIQFGAEGDVAAPGDYDGDNKMDFGIFRPSTGVWWYAASSANGQHRAVQFGFGTDKPVPNAYVR